MSGIKRGALVFGDEEFIEEEQLPVDLEEICEFEVVPGRSLHRAEVPKAFRGDWLRVEPHPIAGLQLVSLRIGNTEQLAVGAIPTSAFRERDPAQMLSLVLPAADRGHIVTLEFENLTDDAIWIACWLEGSYLDE